MSSPFDKAMATQLSSFKEKTGRTLEEWTEFIRRQGPSKHGEIVATLKREHGLSHGYANLVAINVSRPEALAGGGGQDQIDALYEGKFAAVRPLHDAVMNEVRGFGNDIEEAPKKTYVSLRRAKQFAMVGPLSGGRLELSLNLPGEPVGGRLEPAKGMADRRVRVREPSEIDDELIGWLRAAYERAGPK